MHLKSTSHRPDGQPTSARDEGAMMTRTDRRRFPILFAAIAALALAMALLFSPVQAQEGSAPDQPTGLDATATHDQVVLTWDDPGDASITGYVILRRVRVNNTGGEFSELVADTGTAATTYTDATVKANTTYTYRIKATNEHGVSERSRWFHINVPAAPEPEEEQAPEPPDQPTGLDATATHDQVVLTWDDPDDDTITGYVILRRVRVNDTGGEFSVLVADTGTAATTYTDATVKANTTYTYRIKAINEHGVSERSRWFHIDTPAAPEAVEGDDPDGEDDDGAPGGPGKRANVSEPDGEDLPEGITTTGRVEVGGSVTGEIAQALDVDWFAVELKKGKRYQFDVEGADTGRGNLADPHLWGLQDAEGQAISGARSNDGGVGKNGRVINTPDAEGTYYIAVSGAANTTGTYTLSVIVLGANGVSEADTDFPRTTATTGRVEVGASATGNIDPGDDLDGFRVNLEAGKRYRFDLEGADTGRGSQADPILALYGDSFNVSHYIDEDDDGGEGLNSRLTYTATATGAYHLEVAGLDPGTYTLSVRRILVAVAVPPGGLGPSEVPGAVRNVQVSGTERTRVVYWDAPDETQTGAQWITEFRIYASTGAGCDGWKAAEYEVEHPGFTTPPEHPDGTPTGFRYFKIVEVASDVAGSDGFSVQFGVSAVNDLGEGPCVGEPAPASKPALADGPPGLAPNAPNPFNATTLIPYRLDTDGPVRLEIYNLLGQSIRTLVDEVQTAGSYRVSWDARDATGRRVSTGIYFTRLHYPGGVQTRRMLYLE